MKTKKSSTKKWLVASGLFLTFLLAPKVSDACSGAVWACGSSVTIQAIMADAQANCPSGSEFAIFHCDGGAFWVRIG